VSPRDGTSLPLDGIRLPDPQHAARIRTQIDGDDFPEHAAVSRAGACCGPGADLGETECHQGADQRQSGVLVARGEAVNAGVRRLITAGHGPMVQNARLPPWCR